METDNSVYFEVMMITNESLQCDLCGIIWLIYMVTCYKHICYW